MEQKLALYHYVITNGELVGDIPDDLIAETHVMTFDFLFDSYTVYIKDGKPIAAVDNLILHKWVVNS